MNETAMKTLSLSDVEWTITAEPEDIEVRGNALASGDDDVDREMEDSIIEDLENGNEWAWCCAAVTGRWEGLEETEYLGGCSYQSADDFKQGGYYEQMQAEVLERLQEQAERIAGAMADEQ